MTKESQTWGYWAPAHDPQAAKEWQDGSSKALKTVGNSLKTVGEAADRGLYATVGGVAGALGGLWDGAGRADAKYGWKSFNPSNISDSLKTIWDTTRDSAKAGVYTGWKRPDLFDKGLMTWGANVLANFPGQITGFVSDDLGNKVNSWVDRSPLGKWRDYVTDDFSKNMEQWSNENNTPAQDRERAMEWMGNGIQLGGAAATLAAMGPMEKGVNALSNSIGAAVKYPTASTIASNAPKAWWTYKMFGHDVGNVYDMARDGIKSVYDEYKFNSDDIPKLKAGLANAERMGNTEVAEEIRQILRDAGAL